MRNKIWIAQLLLATAIGFATAPVLAEDLARAVAIKGNPGGWITAEDYPPAALRAELQGEVTVHLYIGPDGLIKKCEVEQSSGHDSLDAATCRLLGDRARFEPALDARGQPIESDAVQRLGWRFPNGPDRLLQDDWLEWHFDIDATGKEERCVIVRPLDAGAMASCARGGFKDDGSFERLQSVVGKSRSVQQVWRRTINATDPVLIADRPGWTRLLTQRGGFIYDRDGVPRDCKMDLTRGPDILITSMCESARGRGVPLKDAAGNPIDQPVRFDLVIFVKPIGK